MNNVNLVILLGSLGTNPEKLPTTDSLGVRFRMATNETYRNKKETNDNNEQAYVTQTEWHSIKAWNQNAKFTMDNVSVGDCVLVIGKLHYHKPKGQDDRDIKVRTSEIIAQKVILVNKQKKPSMLDIANAILTNIDTISSLMVDSSIKEEDRIKAVIEMIK